MAFLPTAPFLTSRRSSPPSTPAWRFPARHAGFYPTTALHSNASPLWSSPSPAQGRATLLPAVSSLPSQQHLRLNTTCQCASTATPSVMDTTSLASTLYIAPMHQAATGVLAPTPPGITLVPPPPTTRRAVHAHIPRISVSYVPALTRHTLPSAPTVLPMSPVRRVGRMMRCTSTGGLAPPLLLTFGGCYSYFVAHKGGLVLSQACYALRNGDGPTSESP